MVDFTTINGPTRQIPATQNSPRELPRRSEEPEWMKLSTVCPAPAGSVLNRQQRNGTAPISGTAQRCVRFAQDAASVAHRGKMWRIGGETASVSVYDPIMNQWERGVELPSPRSGLRAVEHCGSIYVFGDGPPLRYADNARRWEAIRGFYNLRDGTYGHVCRSGFLM